MFAGQGLSAETFELGTLYHVPGNIFVIAVGVVACVAEQLAAEPPFVPTQVHDHGPVPVTADALPTEHRLLVGMDESEAPFELPQVPLTVTTDS